ncbi:signal peptidase II [Neoehrlichia mikurensis]|uniref:Lipoprotein signal peptidase n=1 Tax=Neoehrlichia mikurensis TaxID=89586 RepID=A0A9Q9F3X2_9RICK|nr:signal peptidase II [Neoehrlichia mikurensis]QXK91638.1 signal peptidase II [Neoehrlichia mikurensis]QXK92849.1 signal peptidase II [Neoehrlichia mikurensis]QXK93329.1 signal peptidase II [Neoehrlichia mikurensis]UTO55729.1 signal peptidase II [Neoehrlichia mikurensis]UTO56646.1 signal peptidase II [Neoehrlichia mikurensis]
MKFIINIILISLVTAFDQCSKWYVMAILHYNNDRVITLCKYLDIVMVWNPGISFGMFSVVKNSNMIFSLLSCFIVLVLLYYSLFKLKKSNHSFIVAVIVGGAFGNLIDRLRFGAVFDFIDIHIAHWHWPVFNVADTFIVCGIITLLCNCFVKVRNDVD